MVWVVGRAGCLTLIKDEENLKFFKFDKNRDKNLSFTFWKSISCIPLANQHAGEVLTKIFM